MQDKLIEESRCAHKRVVHRPMPIEGGLWTDRWYCDLCRCEFTPLAAVRAHDAGTDEEVISYRARQIWRRFVGIPITEPYTAEFQWLLDLLSGNEAPKKTLTEAVQEARGNLEPPTVPIRFASPASHAAESALPALTCACCGNETPTLRSVGIMPDMCEPCAKHAESAQLDAEDQHRAAEPVTGEPTAWSAQDHTEEYVKQGYITEQPEEDVGDGSCDECGAVPSIAIPTSLCDECRHRLLKTRKGYVKLEDVEKAIEPITIGEWGIAGKTNPHASNGFERANHILEKRRARLAPKPEPTQSAVIDTLRSEDFQRANACIECGAIIVHQELHVKWHAALVERRTK